MDCGIQTPVLKAYTLLVSCGPTNDHVKIEASRPLTVGSNSPLTLTCTASVVYPDPKYTWLDGPCRGVSVNTCSFVPQREQDGQTVTYMARARVTISGLDRKFAIATFTLDAKYPTIDPPVILKAGDTLSYTVTGGKPLVQSVHFSCDGQPDSRNQSSVSSSAVIHVSRITQESVACTCTAYWQPQPELYSLYSTVNVVTKVVQGPHFAKHIEVPSIVGGVIGGLAVIAAAAVDICWRRLRYRRKKAQPGSDQDSILPSVSNTSSERQASVDSAYLEPEPCDMSIYGDPVENNTRNQAPTATQVCSHQTSRKMTIPELTNR